MRIENLSKPDHTNTRTPTPCSFHGPILLLTGLAALPLHAQLATHTFGSGANTFTMDFVTIGNPGNQADTSPAGWGAVATTYLMGKHEVSQDMITKANTLGNLGITAPTSTPSRPAMQVQWNEAARFVNWLNTSQGFSPAYKFLLQPGDGGYIANANIQLWTVSDAGYDAANPYRNSQAHYFLPSENEWYKAAYFSPGGVYYDYPMGSDSAPTAVHSGTTAGTAVYSGTPGHSTPADITLAGGLSPYGTMGQGGNADEWTESAFDGGNDSASESRTVRGGSWISPASDLESSGRYFLAPSSGSSIGFRVAAVPEPMESAGAVGLAALGFALWRRRGVD